MYDDCRDYRGKVDTSESGKKCVDWERFSKDFDEISSSKYPDDGLDSNYCRNPIGTQMKTLWCYTLDDSSEKQKEECDIHDI